MTRTLKNWTVHGQCLGDMVECYRHNNRDYTPKQRSEICHFFNTASNILDTIGSMTESSILRSVEFPSRWQKNLLQGGSLTGSRHTQIGNRPEAKLFPTRDNLLKYTAIYPGADFNVAHVEPYQPIGNIFSANYPDYPDSTTMVDDPTSVAMGRLESDYSTDSGDDGYPHPRIKTTSSDDDDDSYV